MNVNESAAASTKVVGASEEKAMVLYLVLFHGKQTSALYKVDEVDHVDQPHLLIFTR